MKLTADPEIITMTCNGSARRSKDGRSRQEAETVRPLGMRRTRPFAEDLFKEDAGGKETVSGGPQ